MVGAPASADAVTRARRLPGLKVGLHLTVVDGRPVLPPARIPDLAGPGGAFRAGMAAAGFRYFFLPRVRRQLAMEIRAQFEAFRATGLALDHANAHKHLHVHPVVADLMLAIGRDYGLKAVRVPWEPAAVLRRAGAGALPLAYAPWIARLRRKIAAAGMMANDTLLGLRWTGAMTEPRLQRLLAVLPEGVSELYCHPATEQNAPVSRSMPRHRPVEELAALLSPRIRQAVAASGAVLCAYGDLAPV